MSLRIAVLASGSGTNFQALADACAAGYVDGEVVCVAGNKRKAKVMERAERAGVEQVVVPHKGLEREAVDELMLKELDVRQVDLVCYAGYMRIRGDMFTKALAGRTLNIHPSLLPAFPGASPIADAWAWGVKTSGATVHFSSEELDMGPIVIQRAFEVIPDDTIESFEAKIHLIEYAIYPKAVKLYAEGKLQIEGRTVTITEDVEDPPWAGKLPPGLRHD